MSKTAAIAAPVFIFLAGLTLYVLTMPPSIAIVGYAADTLKFQYIGKVFGTPHFGYPTYMFLNILFSRLPFFELAYRLNLLSALLASATLVTLYFIILFLIGTRPTAIACSLMLGVAYTYWENAIIAEVYSINALFASGLLLLMLHWGTSKRPLFFYLGCLAYALSFGTHPIMITLLPALVYWTFAVDANVLLKKKTWVLIPLFIGLGMMQYGYVLLRSHQSPPQEKVFQSWPYTEEFGATHVEMYTRSIPELFDEGSGGSWRVTLGQYSPAEVVRDRFSFFRELFLLQFSPMGVLLGVSGIGLALVRERKRALFLLLLLLVHLGFVMTWAGSGHDVHVIFAYLILTILIAHNDNLFLLPPFSRRPSLRRAGRACLAILLAGLVVFLTVSRYRKIDQSKNVWLANMTDNVLAQLPDDTLVFTNHVYATAFWYKLYGEEVRPGSRITVHPIWQVYYEDLDYALRHYRHVFYFLDEPYWPMLKEAGIDFEVHTFSQYALHEYLSAREPGEIIALYANVNDRVSATNVAHACIIPPPEPGEFALVGIVDQGGIVRVKATARGPLSLAKGTDLGGTELPADIFIVPGKAIYVDGLSCSRYKKANNLVLIDAAGGGISDMISVDWSRSAEVEPAHFLLVKGF